MKSALRPVCRSLWNEPGVVFGQHICEHGVVALDRGHRLIHGRTNGRLPRLNPQTSPARLRRHPKNVLSRICIPVLQGVFIRLGEQIHAALLECIGDVLEENQSQDNG